ncbi:hypothetical protein IMSHALPRED_007019 [Imshaugia aleurites]|uniref:Uncharacterized protein n=1 Tax=Imshaugia aleurites TaxID=172621 RepID=A0A8H3IU74_9LECA|nr:hypothetical protein IMSHALPRED_007019 [Imshaugia aleurites]
MHKSLADELDAAFEDVPLDLADSLDQAKSPKASREETMEYTRKAGDVIPRKCEQTMTTQDSSSTLVGNDRQSPTMKTFSNAALGPPPEKSDFIEHVSSVGSSPQPASHKNHIKLMASVHNRELIGRNADGFFNMDNTPDSVDVRIQQADGIAALQRTLVPTTLPDATSSSTSNSQASSSAAVDSVSRPSSLRQVTFSAPKDRRSHGSHGPYINTASRANPASRFSLARDLIAAGHKKRLAEPSAPARFVKLPTDPVVHFKRNFGEFGLKLEIPGPELEEYEAGDSGSITSLPDVDSAGGFIFRTREPGIDEDRDLKAPSPRPKLDFGVPRAFMPNQCLESTCPIRVAHAIGPYHHLGRRHKRIMTGLFGHSNPPPEIWCAYRNWVRLTSSGKIISPNGRPDSQIDEDLVIAFATFHYGGLNDITGEQFRRRYAGQHISSRIAIQSSTTDSSTKSCCLPQSLVA